MRLPSAPRARGLVPALSPQFAWNRLAVPDEDIVVEARGESRLVYPRWAKTTRVERLRQFARALPEERGTITVLTSDLSGPRLAAVLSSLVGGEGRHRELRLVPTSGGLEQGAVNQVSQSLGVSVVMPVGELMLIPGGTLFPVRPEGDGAWLRHGPRGGRPQGLGPWHFGAAWGDDLGQALVRLRDQLTAGGKNAVRILAVPAGLALLAAHPSAQGIEDVLFSIPVDEQTPMVVIDRLGDGGLTPAQVADVLRRLPEGLRSWLRLAPCGAEPVQDWTQAVADALGESVTSLTGTPLLIDDQVRNAVLKPTDGPRGARSGPAQVSWHPIVTALTYMPSAGGRLRPPLVRQWRPLGPDLPQIANRVYRLDRDWAIEVVACGVWLRRTDAAGEPMVRGLAFDPSGGPLIVVGRPAEALTDEVWSRVEVVKERVSTLSGVQALVRVLGTSASGGRTTSPAPRPSRALAADVGTALGRLIPSADDFDAQTRQPVLTPLPVPAVEADDVLPPWPQEPSGQIPTFTDDETLAPVDPLAMRQEESLPAVAGQPEQLGADGVLVQHAADRLSRNDFGQQTSEHQVAGDEVTRVAPAAVGPIWNRLAEPRVGPSAEDPVPSPDASGQPLVVPPEPDRVMFLPPGPDVETASTAQQRADFRTAAGSWYSSHLAAITALLAKVPSLRSADTDAVAVDLLAVRAYLSVNHSPIDRRRMNQALRRGDDPTALRHAACVASGLRRLPNYQGVVQVPAELSEAAQAAYRPGTRLSERSIVEGEARSASNGPGCVFVIWSTAGRRVTSLSDGPGADEVLFLPGTSFVVLGVETVADTTRILLRDDQVWAGSDGGAQAATAASLKRDTMARDRIARALTSGGQMSSPAGSSLFRFPIGLVDD